jgi:hypothetical protein
MSHDEHGTALARWLASEPGTEPPEELDDDVVEAIVALRPERAPPPSVTADDILALVSSGPLAAPAAEPEGEVVPFPGAAEPPPAEAGDKATPPPPRWSSLARWGGASGVGLVLAAAATLMFVALPTLQSAAPPSAQSEMAAPVDAPRAPAAEPTEAEEAAAVDTGTRARTGEAAPPPPPAKPQARRRPAPAPAYAPPAPRAEPSPEDDAYTMGGAPVPQRALIPELAEETADAALDDAVADADLEAPEPDLDALRAEAVPTDWSSTAWVSYVSAADQQRLQALLDSSDEAATAGDRALAADLAARGIAPPAAAAQHAALVAFDRYREASNTAAAVQAATQGLQYRSNTPGWSMLAVRLADQLRTSDPQAAATWYRDAAAFNRTR